MKEYLDKAKLMRRLYNVDEPTYDVAFELIENAPGEDVEPIIHAKWIIENINPYSSRTYCSNCGKKALDEYITEGDVYHPQITTKTKLSDYCPWCGAKMYGE